MARDARSRPIAGEVVFDPRGKGPSGPACSVRAGRRHLGAAGRSPRTPRSRRTCRPWTSWRALRVPRPLAGTGWNSPPRPDGRDWRIDGTSTSPTNTRDSPPAAPGAARRTGSYTQLELKLETRNLHALLGQFGYGEFVNRGEANLEGSLVWPGYPYEFAPGSLSGRFKVQASKGQFAKFEPGAGKLLGLISLQSIPRRVTFDFRDIFSEGLAFDRISGEARLARGILLTKDFEVAGPSAFVSMAGEVSLPMETQNLTLTVVPEVGEGVAIAATVLGTPVMGLTTLLLQKLLKNPLGKAVSYEYLVTGSWDNPSVTRIGAPTQPKEAAKPAPPARPPMIITQELDDAEASARRCSRRRACSALPPCRWPPARRAGQPAGGLAPLSSSPPPRARVTSRAARVLLHHGHAGQRTR